MKRVGFILAAFFALFTFHLPVARAAGPPDQGHFQITQTGAVADGSSVSNVKITLQDSSGNADSGDNVTVYSSDSTTRFNGNTNIQTQLDANGSLSFNMTTTTSGGVNVTVQDTSQGSVTVSGSVNFDQPGSPTSTPTPSPTPQPGTCTDSAPGSAPVITNAQSAGPHAITLTWTDATNPVSYYLVSYGVASGNYIYGNPNIGGQGTTSYTVGGLNIGTKYYFVIRAGNGCTPGNFSNEMSTVAGGSSATPTPTHAPVDTSSPTDTPTPDQSVDQTLVPTDTPTPMPTEMPTPAPAATGSSTVGTIVTVGTVIGFLIIVGVVAWIIILRRRTPPPRPPISY